MFREGAELRHYNFWILIYPAPDVAGQWIAHCLDLDVITQGTSLVNALQMVAEAVTITLIDDIEGGIDPITRRAPDEVWSRLERLQREGDVCSATPEQLAELDAQGVVLATQLQFLSMTQMVPGTRTLPRPIDTYWSQSASAPAICA